MGTTARLALPYPEITDPPDGANQMEALAEALDGAVQAGSTSIPVSTVSGGGPTGSTSVSFPRPFAAAPVVVVSSGNGYYVATVTAITTTGCTINVRDHRGGTGTSAGVPVQWVAVGKPS